jgi:Sigma-70 factor, region 1.1/Sigma-70 factor, region 1.2
MISKIKTLPQQTLAHNPLLDLSHAAVKKLIRSAKKRGYVTHDQINSVLPSEEVNSEQIEDVLAMFREMGVNFVETQETSEEGAEPREEADEEAENEVQQEVPAKAEVKEPTERTDDPVRMYLRELGSVKLLSRQGEIAIAKRIEAGREAMIAGLCESPLTFQAIIIWRDELNEGKVSFPKIISGHNNGAARTGLGWRQWYQTAGLPDPAACLYPRPSACAPDCNTPHKKKEFVAGVPRQRSAPDRGTRAARCQSGARHMHFAMATQARSVDRGCPLPSPGT